MIDVYPCMPYTIYFKDYPIIIARNDTNVYVILHNNIFKAGRTIYPRGTFRVLFESTKIDFNNFERELDCFKDRVFRHYPGYIYNHAPYSTQTRYPNITSSTEYIQRYETASRMYVTTGREDMLNSGGTYV